MVYFVPGLPSLQLVNDTHHFAHETALLSRPRRLKLGKTFSSFPAKKKRE
jgi:hypothetical protein